jgi:aminoglycoside phosphotransferase (APT) family kinase protein
VLDETARLCGGAPSVERLGGMSGAAVFRARARRSVIIKATPRHHEPLFYETMAPALRDAGVPIPGLYALHRLDGRAWLFMEDVPAPLVHRPDTPARMMAVLACLHGATRGLDLNFPDSPSRHWGAAQTDAALAIFGPPEASDLRPVLEAFQQRALRLADHWCWISGDTSPPNWGVRPDGGLVLFDWELFRRGTPAGDIAPAVPGLPDVAAFAGRAAAYVDAWEGEDLPWTAAELARDAAVAKVQTVVMLLAAQASGAADVPPETITWLTANAPAWLRSLAAELGTPGSH